MSPGSRGLSDGDDVSPLIMTTLANPTRSRATFVRADRGRPIKVFLCRSNSIRRVLPVRPPNLSILPHDQLRGFSGSSVKGADDHEVGASQVSVQGGSLDVIRGPITRDANSRTCLKYRLKIGCDAASVDQSINAEVCSKITQTLNGNVIVFDDMCSAPGDICRPGGSGAFYPTMEWTTVCSHLNPTWEITHRAPEMEDAFRMFKIYVEERAPDAAEVEATYEFGDPERPELLAGCLGTDAANERFRINDRLAPNGQCCGSYEFNPFSSDSVGGLECANAIEEGSARPTRSPITDSPTVSPTIFCHQPGFNCGWVGTFGQNLEQCAQCCGEGAPTIVDDWESPVQHFCGTCLPPNVQCGARRDAERCRNCCYQSYTRDTWAGNRYFCGDESHGTQGPSRSPITASPTSGPTIQCRDDGHQCSDLRDCDHCCSDTRVDNTWDGVQHYCGPCLQAGIRCGAPDDDTSCSRCCVQYYTLRHWNFRTRYYCGPETGHEGISDAESILPY